MAKFRDPNEYMRTNRYFMLKASDWTQLPDSPLSDSKKAEWATYRQLLRDVPDNNTPEIEPDTGNLISVTWPTEPE